MNSGTVKNIAVTGLCIVTAIVLWLGYRRLDRVLTLVETRSDALYSLAISAEQRNRAAIDESARVGAEINAVLAHVRVETLPRVSKLLAVTASTVSSVDTAVQTVDKSAKDLSQSAVATLEQLQNVASLTAANVNTQVSQNGQALEEILSLAASRVGDGRIDQVMDSVVESSTNLTTTSLHLAKTLEQFQGVATDLKSTSAHAPAIAASVDKIFAQQKKWSGALLILQALSLIR